MSFCHLSPSNSLSTVALQIRCRNSKMYKSKILHVFVKKKSRICPNYLLYLSKEPSELLPCLTSSLHQTLCQQLPFKSAQQLHTYTVQGWRKTFFLHLNKYQVKTAVTVRVVGMRANVRVWMSANNWCHPRDPLPPILLTPHSPNLSTPFPSCWVFGISRES